jgi:hypothetical protein
MFEILAKALSYGLIIYGCLGLLFAVPFVCLGVQRLDSASRGSSVGFRLLILPGVAAFWPIFLDRWRRGIAEPPAENAPPR